MAGASIETTLELWALSLRDVKARIRPLFGQKRVAASAGQFLGRAFGERTAQDGLDACRKWRTIPACGCQQAILGRGRWDADALRDIVCAMSRVGNAG